jgi:hypothetical protein
MLDPGNCVWSEDSKWVQLDEEYDRFLQNLLQKFKLPLTVAEKVKFISLILHSWSVKMITAEFGVSEHTVTEGGGALQKTSGILPEDE